MDDIDQFCEYLLTPINLTDQKGLKLTMERKYYFLSRQYIAARELKRHRILRTNALIASQVLGQMQFHPEVHRQRWHEEYQKQGWNAESIEHWTALTQWQPGQAFPRAPYSAFRNMPWMSPQIRDFMARQGYPGAECDLIQLPPDLDYLIPGGCKRRRTAGTIQDANKGQEVANASAQNDSSQLLQPARSSGANSGPSVSAQQQQYGVPVIPNAAGLVGAPIVNTNFPWMQGITTNGAPHPSLAVNQGLQQQSLPQSSAQPLYSQQAQSVQQPPAPQYHQAPQGTQHMSFQQQGQPAQQQGPSVQQQLSNVNQAMPQQQQHQQPQPPPQSGPSQAPGQHQGPAGGNV